LRTAKAPLAVKRLAGDNIQPMVRERTTVGGGGGDGGSVGDGGWFPVWLAD